MLTARPSEDSEHPDLGRTSGAVVVAGGLWSVLGRTLPQLHLLVLSIVAARFLGPGDMGRQSFIAFVSLTVVAVATAGFPASTSRFVGELLGARAGGAVLGLYRWTWRLESVAAALAAAGLLIAAALGSEPALAWALAGIMAGLAVLQSVPQALLSGAQRWRDATIVGIVIGLAAVPAAIVVLALGGGIAGLFAVEAVAAAASLAWTARLARRLALRLAPRAPMSSRLRRRFVRFAAVTTAIVLVQYVVWTRSELVVLAHDSTDAQIALYSISFATVAGLAGITQAMTRALMPAIATLLGAGELDRVRAGFWRAIRVLSFVTPLVAGAALVVGPALLTLAYGSAYAGAGDVLRVLLGPLLLAPFVATGQALLFALGRVRFLLVAGLVATVVDVALAIALVPSLDAVGAALANGAAQLVAGIPCLVLAARLNAPVALPWAALARGFALAVAVALAAGAALLAAGDGWLGAGAAVLAGLVAFLLVAPAARPLAAEDAVWLAAALAGGGRLRARLAALIPRLAPAP